ncbi:hypothetical protein TNCV_1584201 [Trichonephila clavipes]|nr:hypothetical protein TNCV_1584201 [Trichonephila clavipes]
MNGGHGQSNGTTLCLLMNLLPATSGWSDSIWRHPGGRLLNCCVVHCHTGPAPSIMVWRGIGFHCCTPLVCGVVGVHGPPIHLALAISHIPTG